MIKQIFALLVLTLSLSTQAAVIHLAASLDGTQEVPPNASPGTGSATVTLDDVTGELSWEVQWSGLTGIVSAAHFHGPALPGVNAGVQVALDSTQNPTAGSVVISGQQQADLLAGLWYINVHTDLFPGGEIRGQVNVIPLPAAAWLFGSAVLGLVAVRRRRA